MFLFHSYLSQSPGVGYHRGHSPCYSAHLFWPLDVKASWLLNTSTGQLIRSVPSGRLKSSQAPDMMMPTNKYRDQAITWPEPQHAGDKINGAAQQELPTILRYHCDEDQRNLHAECDEISKTSNHGPYDEGQDDPDHMDKDDGWRSLLSSSIYIVNRALREAIGPVVF